jgi:hypothetical protein
MQEWVKRQSAVSEQQGSSFIGLYRLGGVLICERGARLRHLDLKVAAADAAHWWRTGQIPLRPTPRESLKDKSFIVAPNGQPGIVHAKDATNSDEARPSKCAQEYLEWALGVIWRLLMQEDIAEDSEKCGELKGVLENLADAQVALQSGQDRRGHAISHKQIGQGLERMLAFMEDAATWDRFCAKTPPPARQSPSLWGRLTRSLAFAFSKPETNADPIREDAAFLKRAITRAGALLQCCFGSSEYDQAISTYGDDLITKATLNVSALGDVLVFLFQFVVVPAGFVALLWATIQYSLLLIPVDVGFAAALCFLLPTWWKKHAKMFRRAADLQRRQAEIAEQLLTCGGSRVES